MTEPWFKTPSTFVTQDLRHVRTLGELKVLIALRHFTNSGSGEAWPSISKLAEVCGIGRGNVSRAISKLLVAGLIERISSGGRSGESSRYRFNEGSRPGATPAEPLAARAQQSSRPSATPLAAGAQQPSRPCAALSEEDQTSKQKNDQTRAVDVSSAHSLSGSGKKPASGELPAIPPALDTPAFRTAWANFVSYRRHEKRKPIGPLSASRLFADLEPLGPDVAIERINRAIANSWQGVVFFEQKGANHHGNHNGHHKPAHAGTQENLRL